jgi:hypothetical protein
LGLGKPDREPDRGGFRHPSGDPLATAGAHRHAAAFFEKFTSSEGRAPNLDAAVVFFEGFLDRQAPACDLGIEPEPDVLA